MGCLQAHGGPASTCQAKAKCDAPANERGAAVTARHLICKLLWISFPDMLDHNVHAA